MYEAKKNNQTPYEKEQGLRDDMKWFGPVPLPTFMQPESIQAHESQLRRELFNPPSASFFDDLHKMYKAKKNKGDYTMTPEEIQAILSSIGNQKENPSHSEINSLISDNKNRTQAQENNLANNAKQNEMIRMLMGLFGGPASITAQIMKGAHDNINALISNNENKDFFELQANSKYDLTEEDKGILGFSIADEVPEGVEGTYGHEQEFLNAEAGRGINSILGKFMKKIFQK